MLCWSENFTIVLLIQAEIDSGASISNTTSPTGTTARKTPSAVATNSDGINQTWFTTRDDKHAYQKGGQYYHLILIFKKNLWIRFSVQNKNLVILHYL